MQGDTTIASITNEINAPAVNGYQAEDQESIAAAICWYPGNLFIGPDTNSRADDPGENFESKAYIALGNRFDVLDRLNTNIDAFILNPVQPLNPAIIADLNTMMGWNTPKEYNPIAWNKVYGKHYLVD